MPPNRHITPIEPSDEPPIAPPVATPPTKAELEEQMQAACRATWAAYSLAYRNRYRVAPVRNAKVNGQVRELVKRIGQGEAPQVAAWFVENVSEHGVVKACHDVGSLLFRAEAYRTQWLTNRQVTDTSARQQDQTQANASAADDAKALLRRLKGNANAQ